LIDPSASLSNKYTHILWQALIHNGFKNKSVSFISAKGRDAKLIAGECAEYSMFFRISIHVFVPIHRGTLAVFWKDEAALKNPILPLSWENNGKHSLLRTPWGEPCFRITDLIAIWQFHTDAASISYCIFRITCSIAYGWVLNEVFKYLQQNMIRTLSILGL